MKLILLCLVAAAACTDVAVGRLCDLGGPPPQISEVVISTNSLDCPTRTCLRIPLSVPLPPGSDYPRGTSGLCTARCESDSDCEADPASPCTGGFTCAVAQTVGTDCCVKVCQCRDYGVNPFPKACDPEIESNTCPNLPGRS